MQRYVRHRVFWTEAWLDVTVSMRVFKKVPVPAHFLPLWGALRESGKYNRDKLYGGMVKSESFTLQSK